MKKIYNFSAGPAMLSPFVLEATSQATIEYNDHGMSLMEMSHRSQPVVNMVKESEKVNILNFVGYIVFVVFF